MKILVCGSRDWHNRRIIYQALFRYKDYSPITIIEGGARGADSIAKEVGASLGFQVEEYKAEWNQYSQAAGPIRNRRMIEEGKPDLVLAFHNNIELSKGTKNMVEQAKKAGIKAIIIKSEEK